MLLAAQKSPIVRALHYALAMLRLLWWKLRGFDTLVTPDEQESRKALCYPCFFYDVERDECRVCGCPIEAKTPLASEECPKKKWVAVWRKTLHYS